MLDRMYDRNCIEPTHNDNNHNYYNVKYLPEYKINTHIIIYVHNKGIITQNIVTKKK